ncbi:MAG: hypothetical protein ACYC1E_11815 [Propionibacteriaceae bacterium]
MTELLGLAALATALMMFLAPAVTIPLWPWMLTSLTCRVVGAVFCLGVAGIGVFVGGRWVAIRLMVQVETLMLVASVRAWGELAQTAPSRGSCSSGSPGSSSGPDTSGTPTRSPREGDRSP